MCIQISQRRGRPSTHTVQKLPNKGLMTHSTTLRNKETSYAIVVFQRNFCFYKNQQSNFQVQFWSFSGGVSNTVHFLLLSNTFIFQGKEMEKRGASSISHHLSSTQWLKIWKNFFYAFNDLTHLWQVKQLFCVWQRAIWTSLCLV